MLDLQQPVTEPHDASAFLEVTRTHGALAFGGNQQGVHARLCSAATIAAGRQSLFLASVGRCGNQHPLLTPAQSSVVYHLPLVAFSLWFSLVPVKEGLSGKVTLASVLLCTAWGILSSDAAVG